MARNATMKALAKEDCFTSTSGLPWLAANGMMHHLPVPTMRQHIEDAYMKPCGPYRACDNCPPSPASLKVFVAQGTCNMATRQTHPSGSWSPASETTALGPSNRRTIISFMRSARLRSGATLYASASALLSDWRPLRCHKRPGSRSRRSAPWATHGHRDPS